MSMTTNKVAGTLRVPSAPQPPLRAHQEPASPLLRRIPGARRTDGNLDQSWSLSEVGDWDSVTTEGTTQNRTYGPTHELLTAGGQSLSTDVNGNITLIPSNLRPNTSSLLMNWDMDNRLSTADVGNNSSVDVTYKFDALGRRVYRDDGTTAVHWPRVG
ncbi:MAG: hypothetical protein R3C53_24705 [Pirellulaceae bacterium]